MTPTELRNELRKTLDVLNLQDSPRDDDIAVAQLAALVAINDTLRDIASELGNR